MIKWTVSCDTTAYSVCSEQSTRCCHHCWKILYPRLKCRIEKFQSLMSFSINCVSKSDLQTNAFKGKVQPLKWLFILQQRHSSCNQRTKLKKQPHDGSSPEHFVCRDFSGWDSSTPDVGHRSKGTAITIRPLIWRRRFSWMFFWDATHIFCCVFLWCIACSSTWIVAPNCENVKSKMHWKSTSFHDELLPHFRPAVRSLPIVHGCLEYLIWLLRSREYLFWVFSDWINSFCEKV